MVDVLVKLPCLFYNDLNSTGTKTVNVSEIGANLVL